MSIINHLSSFKFTKSWGKIELLDTGAGEITYGFKGAFFSTICIAGPISGKSRID
jgi:hypothetical protein